MTQQTPEPVFTAPWHAQVFALTVHLHDRGHFAWPRWTDVFSDTLKRHGLSKELDGGDDYFLAWVEALEALLADKASASEIGRVTEAWRAAYLATPHGQPVRLAAKSGPSS